MTTYSATVARTWRENRMFSALLELTYRCNLDCFFCYNDTNLRGQALSTQRYLELLDELAELGVLHLTLSGGEPLAHRDFFRIGQHARERGFVVRVKSNGHALHGELARRLVNEVAPYILETSLHGATAEVHERQTRVPGSFSRLVRNITLWRELGLRVQVNSTLTSWNEDQVEQMFALADGLAVPLRFDPEVSPRDDGDRDPLTIAPSFAGVRRLFQIEIDRSHASGAAGAELVVPDPRREEDVRLPPATGGKYCGAGSSNVAIDPFGNVYPCVQWRRPVGNLHRNSLREIWSLSAPLTELRELSVEIGRNVAAFGSDAQMLSFCPGSAEKRVGSPLEMYPEAQRRREAARLEIAEASGRARLRVLP